MDNKIIVTEKAKPKGKTIQINPEFLKLNGNSRKNTTLKRKQKPIQTQTVETNPSLVKKKLIEKIQAFKNKSLIEKSKDNIEEKEREKFNNEFNKSLDFLQSLSNKRKENKEQNKVQQNKVQQNKVQHNKVQQTNQKTLKHGKIERMVHNEVINEILETELPPELSSTFRYPPQKNINFSIEENIVIETPPIVIETPPIVIEPMQSQPMQSQPMQSDPISFDEFVKEPIKEHVKEPVKEPIKEPAYSNLKNGSKPTFREWKNQTVKNHHLPRYKKLQIDEEPISQEPVSQEPVSQEPVSQEPVSQEPVSQEPSSLEPISKESILQELKEFIQKPKFEDKSIESIKDANSIENKSIDHTEQLSMENPLKIQSIKKITTRTLKYKLGKRGKKVGVLIKNAKTRKIIQREYALLKQKQISDIKNYLRSKNLLKIGSDAPNDVLRQMYEQAILSGEVENKAGETLIHNFMHS